MSNCPFNRRLSRNESIACSYKVPSFRTFLNSHRHKRHSSFRFQFTTRLRLRSYEDVEFIIRNFQPKRLDDDSKIFSLFSCSTCDNWSPMWVETLRPLIVCRTNRTPQIVFCDTYFPKENRMKSKFFEENRRKKEVSKVQPCYSVDGWPPVWCLAGTCLALVQLLPDITTMETNFFDIVWELNTGQSCWRDTSAKFVVVFPSFMGPGQERTVNIVAPVICWDVYRPLFVHQPDKHSATQFSLHKKKYLPKAETLGLKQ